MYRTTVPILCVIALFVLVAFTSVAVQSQNAPRGNPSDSAVPDFSGVYYPFQQGRGDARGGAAANAGQRGAPAATGQRASTDAIGPYQRSVEWPVA
jgi:hypothetical protein